jgi:hypothetical protein
MMAKPKGFEEPNYTQTPNKLFDEIMKEIDTMAELKVTLAIIRQTTGWHRRRCTFGIAKIERLTGLARNSVTSGAEAAEARGTIRRLNKEGEASWELVINDTPATAEGVENDPSFDEDTPPQDLTKNPSTVEGLKRKKQIDSNKDNIINSQSLELFASHFGKFKSQRELERWALLFDSVGDERANALAVWASKKEIHLTNRPGLIDSMETAAKNWQDHAARVNGKRPTAAQSSDPNKYVTGQYAEFLA